MGNKAKAWLGAGTILLAFVAAALALPALFNATGTRGWLLRGGLLFFGVVAAVLVLLYLLARARARQEPEIEGGDDIGQAIAAAEARLAASNLTTESHIGRLPLAVVLGTSGSTKSSVLMHSGLDPELLAGEVMRGDTVVPTDPVNVWYAHGTILVEAGGRLLEDAARWRRLLRQLRPRRLAAAFGRGRQAPRIAIVCFACDDFLKPGASQNVAATARHLRARLGEIAQELGIRLPVYVLFTRADRVPYFADYVRNFTNEEAHQVVGATLPLSADTGGAWAERESRRLNDAFGRIVHALSLRRLDVLTREAQEGVRAAAYEFPREMRKLVDPAVQLLLDVFRPSQLGVTPFLRGVYFTGVRPVVITDVAAQSLPAARATPDAGATSVFSAAMMRQAAQPAPVAPGAGRKVPQWVFLQRLFRDVVLRDDAILRITGGGTRVDLLRRGLIASAAAACVVLALGFTVSFAGNRALVRRSIAAAEEARDIGTLPGTPTEADLAKLDTLRQRTDRVTRYQRDGRPLRFAWGLYTGERVQPTLYRMYFDRFDPLLLQATRERVNQYLQGLPARPDENSDFGRAQDALAVHLLTSSEHRRSTPDLLAPALMSFWRGGEATEEARALALQQFEYYAGELPFGNPYSTNADAPLVERSREFLRAFGMEAYYNALVYAANSEAQPARYTGPANIVRNDVVIPGAFTMAGMRNVRANLDSVDNLFVRYQWMYGDKPPENKPRREDLARMYENEYVSRWQDYIGRGSVERFTSLGDAAGKATVLGSTGSPLFGMLAVAARETNMDTLSLVGRAFQPLHATVAPDADPRAVTGGVLGYTNALNALGSQLNLLANATGPARDQGALQAVAGAAAVKTEAGSIAANFTMSGHAAVTGNSIQRLLRQPADFAEGLISGLSGADLREAGASFCAQYAPITRRFPFRAGAPDAAVDEVSAIFQKEDGQISSFYQNTLQPLLTPQGRQKPGATRVRQDFINFFSRAVDFSNALYGGGAGASLAFDFQPEIPAGASEVTLTVDGRSVSFTPTSRASRTFSWDADRGREALLIAVVGGERITVAQGDGAWAVFKLFHAGDWSGSGRHRVEWRVPGRNLSVIGFITFEPGTPAVLDRRFVQPLSQCVSTIAN